MREIKFRAWDKEKNKYIYTSLPDICDDFGFEYSLDDNASDFCSIIKFGGEAELFTGRKDKNGKDIYRNDIVTCGHGNYRVSFENDGYIIDVGNDMYSLSDYVRFGCEVIGNIHENPELIP